jgi:D12 class N6 adenine-specific DNA methyltransferase
VGGRSGDNRKILLLSICNLEYSGQTLLGREVILMNYIDREIVPEPTTSNSTPEPFLKWAGGKRWLFRRYRHLFPQDIKRLIDPFVGGGSSFFYLQPRTAILSDLNSDLIDLYSAVRTHPRMLTKRLVHYHHAHSESFFYKARRKKPSDPVKKSAWLSQITIANSSL